MKNDPCKIANICRSVGVGTVSPVTKHFLCKIPVCFDSVGFLTKFPLLCGTYSVCVYATHHHKSTMLYENMCNMGIYNKPASNQSYCVSLRMVRVCVCGPLPAVFTVLGTALFSQYLLENTVEPPIKEPLR